MSSGAGNLKQENAWLIRAVLGVQALAFGIVAFGDVALDQVREALAPGASEVASIASVARESRWART